MILSVIFSIMTGFIPAYDSSGTAILSEVFLYAIYINWGLFIFNLIPIPPLDGSHLLLYPLRRFPVLYEGLYKYGSFVLIGLLIATAVTKINFLPIWPVIEFFGNGFLTIVGYR
jgi:Zn-dependent protease